MKGRYNITLTAELDKRLDLYSFQTGKSRSALIEEALNQYLSGPIEPLHIIHNDEISILRGRIDLIESRLRDIECSEKTSCVIPESVNAALFDCSKTRGLTPQPRPDDQDHYPIISTGVNTRVREVEITDDIPPVGTDITKTFHPDNDSSQDNLDTQGISEFDPHGWYTQSQVKDKIDSKIPLNTRKGWVSKAVASGMLETNGEKGKDCRIKGSSAIEWLVNHAHPSNNTE